MQKIPHIPVLLQQTLQSFEAVKEGVIIDCTLGYGGHTQALLDRYAHVRVIGIDQDQTAIDFATKRLESYGSRFEAIKGNFAHAFSQALKQAGAQNIVGILADIGVSSLQLDQKNRGFSFDSDVLDMRMNQESTLTAFDVVNTYTQDKLQYIFQEYGEITFAKSIARDIVEARTKAPIISAKQLSALAMNYKGKKKIHPATLLFQAIRIEVNDELGELKALLDAIQNAKLNSTVVTIISFHSLEDRIVKQHFKEWALRCTCAHDAMRCTCGGNNAKGKELFKKPLVADSSEIQTNARSRSAKLRSFAFATATI